MKKETLIKSEKYGGLQIDTNINEYFGTKYYTVINIHIKNKDGSNPHIHCMSENQAKKIVKCYQTIRHDELHFVTFYTKTQRDKAMKLFGLDVYIGRVRNVYV